MRDELAKEMLTSILSAGNTSEKMKTIIGKADRNILDLGSGSARIQRTAAKKFKLILAQPLAVSMLNPFEIRCALCKKVISYPAWYYSIKYAVNHFHYFVCFNSASPNNPSTKCYKREV